jgi:7-cyano-7-deazaguanine synthase
MGAVVLLSGGMDSTIVLAWALRQYGRDFTHALSIDYGQRHARELEAAVRIAKHFRVSHRVASVRIDLAGSLVDAYDADLSRRANVSPDIVPMRNAILLSMAAGYAARAGADTVCIGACEMDVAGFPDCRPEFLSAAQHAFTLATGEPISIVAPLLAMGKGATVKLARELPGCWDALALSWTCYRGGEQPCGECSACVARADGFAHAGECDPAMTEEAAE